jgi:16S rRNA (cytidine1402-2'-O)-methyltransferase
VALRSRSIPSPSSSISSVSRSGTLYLVATPIGNLEDITLRALRILKEVRLIAAEDTRRTAKLLRHYEIKTPTTSFHQHNEKKKGKSLIAKLKRGDSLALVTDAGTPLLSDPGSELVQNTLAEGISVQAIPGPSAILTALVMAGFSAASFTFTGFPPSRSKERILWLKELLKEKRTLVVFEAPHRIKFTLRDMLEILGDRKVSICREMTKMHEELVVGPISNVLNLLSPARGEFTIIVSPPKKSELNQFSVPNDADLWHEFSHLTNKSSGERKNAVKQLAGKYGLGTREAYASIERGKKTEPS